MSVFSYVSINLKRCYYHSALTSLTTRFHVSANKKICKTFYCSPAHEKPDSHYFYSVIWLVLDYTTPPPPPPPPEIKSHDDKTVCETLIVIPNFRLGEPLRLNTCLIQKTSLQLYQISTRPVFRARHLSFSMAHIQTSL